MKRACVLGILLGVACDNTKAPDHTASGDNLESDADAAQDSGDDAIDDGVTWHKDVSPLLEQNCTGCHNPQGISFDLTSYPETALLAEALVGATESGSMPPWPPSRECRPLLHERTLSEADRQILRDWSARGTPEGDPATAPAPAESEFVPPDEDLTLTLPEPYTPIGATDDYRCFVVDPQLTDTARITGFQVHPDNSAIVHHVLVYTDTEGIAATLDERDEGPGYTCFGGPGFNETSVVGAWAPGSPGYRLPHNTAVSLEAGTALVLQVHYSPAGDPGGSDQSSVSFDLADADEDRQSASSCPSSTPDSRSHPVLRPTKRESPSPSTMASISSFSAVARTCIAWEAPSPYTSASPTRKSSTASWKSPAGTSTTKRSTFLRIRWSSKTAMR